MMDEATRKPHMEMKVNGDQICSIKFTDDPTVIDGSVKSLQKLPIKINDST